MKTASTALRAILGSAQFYMADCYSFTLVDGTVVRYTTADQSIVDQATGDVFSASGPFFERSKVKFSAGVQVDELDITMTAGPNDLLQGVPWLSALRAGALDGAELQLDRAFMATFGDTSAGLVTLFLGRVVEVDPGRTQATVKANTHLELLNLQWPWRLFQPGCSRTLFDAGCTLAKSAFADSWTAGSGNSLTVLNIPGMTVGSTHYSLGTGTWTSGMMEGESFPIKDHALVSGAGMITPLVPFPVVPAPGDTVTLYPGCDKTLGTCQNKFANAQHFEGEPFVPVPETAV